MIAIIIQINSYLVTSKLNSPEASYEVSTGKKKETTKQNTKQSSLYIIIIIIKRKGKAIPVTGRGGP
jgi:hypothetical protein